MNYLSHHFVGKATEPDAGACFYAGNLLPDLISASGGRIRAGQLVGKEESDLVRGMRLHLATDRQFHAQPAFLAAMREASALLRAERFSQPPHRVFFLAHVLVEIALDARLLMRIPGIADDLYKQLDTCGAVGIALETETLLGRPLPGLADGIKRFIAARYLYSYAQSAGQATALHRLCQQAGLRGFPGSDQARLATVFAAFAPRLADYENALLVSPNGYETGSSVVQ